MNASWMQRNRATKERLFLVPLSCRVSHYCPEFSERTGECPDGVDDHAGSKGRSNLRASLKSMLGPTVFYREHDELLNFLRRRSRQNQHVRPPAAVDFPITPALRCASARSTELNQRAASQMTRGVKEPSSRPSVQEFSPCVGAPPSRAKVVGRRSTSSLSLHQSGGDRLRVIPQRSAAGPARRAPHAVSTATSADPAASAPSRRQSR